MPVTSSSLRPTRRMAPGFGVNRYNFQGNLSKTLVNGLRGIAGDPQSGVFVVCGTTTKDASDLSASLKGAWHGGQDIVLAGIDGTSGNTLWATQVGGTNDEAATEWRWIPSRRSTPWAPTGLPAW